MPPYSVGPPSYLPGDVPVVANGEVEEYDKPPRHDTVPAITEANTYPTNS